MSLNKSDLIPVFAFLFFKFQINEMKMSPFSVPDKEYMDTLDFILHITT